MHIPIYVLMILSTDALDQMCDLSTARLEIIDKGADFRMYYTLFRSSLIMLSTYEARLTTVYGVDMGQLDRKAYE
jgi:hypothetical protein